MIKNIIFLLLLVALVGSKPQGMFTFTPMMVPGGMFGGGMFPGNQFGGGLFPRPFMGGDILGPGFHNAMADLQNKMTHMNIQMQQMNLKLAVMGISSSMLQGLGGTTIINYNGKTVLVSNSVTTECKGEVAIRDNEVKCNGERVPAQKDICKPGKSMVRSNNRICIFETPNFGGGTTIISSGGITTVNGQEVTQCDNGEVFTEQSLKERCGANVLTQNYAQATYVPNFKEYGYIPMPNSNPYIGCKDPQATVCQFGVDISGFRSYPGPLF